MKNDIAITAAVQQYAAAYAEHYMTKDLPKALQLYKGVITIHPKTQEAEYSRTQIYNIMKAVVPKEKLLDAQLELAFAHSAER